MSRIDSLGRLDLHRIVGQAKIEDLWLETLGKQAVEDRDVPTDHNLLGEVLHPQDCFHRVPGLESLIQGLNKAQNIRWKRLKGDGKPKKLTDHVEVVERQIRQCSRCENMVKFASTNC